MNVVLYVLAESLRIIALLTQAFMPDTISKLLDQLGVIKPQRQLAWAKAEHAISGGLEIKKPEGLFPRYVEENEELNIEKKA